VLDLHRVGEREEPFVDGGERDPRGVLELEGLAETERLAVDEEDIVALLVGNPEVLGDGEDPFPDEIAHADEAIPACAIGGRHGTFPNPGSHFAYSRR